MSLSLKVSLPNLLSLRCGQLCSGINLKEFEGSLAGLPRYVLGLHGW